MRINIGIFITTEREEGTTRYVCRTWRDTPSLTRDPLHSTAMQRMANKVRTLTQKLLDQREFTLIRKWQFEPSWKTITQKLNLSLNDRTLTLKLLFVLIPWQKRFAVMTPTIPQLCFQIDSEVELIPRATEVISLFCKRQLAEDESVNLQSFGFEGEGWIEPLSLEFDTSLERKKRSKNQFAQLMAIEKTSGASELRKVGRCLDELSADFPAVFGRSEQVDQFDAWLRSKRIRSIMLVGKESVGKSAIVQEVVRARVARRTSKERERGRTWLVSPQRLISGMSFLGQWEQRWLSILREIYRKNHILYIDDLLGFLTAGITRDSRLNAAAVLKSFIEVHPIRMIAEITPTALSILRRRDRALAELFQPLNIESLSVSESTSLLLDVCSKIEADSKKYFHPGVLPKIIELTDSLTPQLALPGKAVNLAKSLAQTSAFSINGTDLIDHLESKTGVRLQQKLQQPPGKYQLMAQLDEQVIGQTQATKTLTRYLIRFLNDVQAPDRPLGVFLFMGPTGVGKTETAKALTRVLFESESHLVRFDMNEINNAHAAEQLIGSFDNPEGRLTSAIRRQPHSVLLLDEIEKAHPDVFDYLLQVIGEGRLTDALGRTVDFRNVFLIMTSNIGVKEEVSTLGFEADDSSRESSYLRSATQFFRPEFLNRIDELVVFHRLKKEEIEKIAEMQIQQLCLRDGLVRRQVTICSEPEAVLALVERGYDAQLGARAMKRTIERNIAQPLADRLASFHVGNPVWVRFTAVDKNLKCDAHELRWAERSSPTEEEKIEQTIERVKRAMIELQPALDRIEVQSRNSQSITSPEKITYYSVIEQIRSIRTWQNKLQRRLEMLNTPGSRPSSRAINPSRTHAKPNKHGGSDARKYQQARQHEDDVSIAFSDQLDGDDQRLDNRHVQQNLVHSVKLLGCMIADVGQPMNWVVKVTPLSKRWGFASRQAIVNCSDGSITSETIEYSLPELWLNHLVSFLRDSLQYDVQPESRAIDRRVLSGLGLGSLLRRIAGIYSLKSFKQPGLFALQVLPLEHSSDEFDVDKSIKQRMGVLEDGTLDPTTMPLQTDWRTIIGTLSLNIEDQRTGTQAMWNQDRELLGRWWLDLMNWPMIPRDVTGDN